MDAYVLKLSSRHQQQVLKINVQQTSDDNDTNLYHRLLQFHNTAYSNENIGIIYFDGHQCLKKNTFLYVSF